MSITTEVVGWDVCPHCGKTYEVYAAYISERRTYCKHGENWYHLIYVKKED